MTLEECYSRLNGDYKEIRSRLQVDRLIEKFMLKFPADDTMGNLRGAIDRGDIEASFKAAHTLKGVAVNLGFSGLYKAAVDLTEQLRPCKEQADAELLSKVEEQYKLVIAAIEQYEKEMDA